MSQPWNPGPPGWHQPTLQAPGWQPDPRYQPHQQTWQQPPYPPPPPGSPALNGAVTLVGVVAAVLLLVGTGLSFYLATRDVEASTTTAAAEPSGGGSAAGGAPTASEAPKASGRPTAVGGLPTAPNAPTSKPDIDKVAKRFFDALVRRDLRTVRANVCPRHRGTYTDTDVMGRRVLSWRSEGITIIPGRYSQIEAVLNLDTMTLEANWFVTLENGAYYICVAKPQP